jgi:hypothetical protein
MPDVYRAKEPFAFTDKNGVPRSIVPGDLMTGGDPNLKGREHLFERVEVAAARAVNVVEDASAAPGELRSVSTTKRGRGRRADSAPEQSTEPEASAEPAVAEEN